MDGKEELDRHLEANEEVIKATVKDYEQTILNLTKRNEKLKNLLQYIAEDVSVFYTVRIQQEMKEAGIDLSKCENREQ